MINDLIGINSFLPNILLSGVTIMASIFSIVALITPFDGIGFFPVNIVIAIRTLFYKAQKFCSN